MNRDQLWTHYASRNPSFDGEGNVTMSAAGLRKMFDQTWEKAHEQGFANGQSWEQNQQKMRDNKKSASPMSDLFNDLFKTK